MERDQIGEVYDAGRDAVIDLVTDLLARIDTLGAKVAELEARLGQTPRNSSRPPSSEGYSKPPAKTRSLRRASGRRPGGQPGSSGHHLMRSENPDEVVVHVPTRCHVCDGDLGDAMITGHESRQVFDLPVPTLSVVEHHAERRRCDCGQTTRAPFPTGVGAPTQYGPQVGACAAYLVCYQHLPYARAAELLGDLCGARVSVGTIQAIVARAGAGLEPFVEKVRTRLQGAAVCHFDETGARTLGRLRWIHSAST